jgi:hypothetical protein
MVSTPNSPDGLFEAIEKEPEEICLYKRLFLRTAVENEGSLDKEEIR